MVAAVLGFHIESWLLVFVFMISWRLTLIVCRWHYYHQTRIFTYCILFNRLITYNLVPGRICLYCSSYKKTLPASPWGRSLRVNPERESPQNARTIIQAKRFVFDHLPRLLLENLLDLICLIFDVFSWPFQIYSRIDDNHHLDFQMSIDFFCPLLYLCFNTFRPLERI